MAFVTIPGLPAGGALSDSDPFETVQAGVSVRVTAEQIGEFVLGQLVAGGNVTIVDNGDGTFTISAAGGITQLTGDVLAGPGAGSQAATVVQAPKWTTARMLTLTGDLSGNVSFNGTANFNLPATLANSGVAPGSYTRTSVTFDAKGRATAASSGIASVVTFATDPTVNDDSGDGYGVGQLWMNSVTGMLWKLLDATLGAAVWRRVDMPESGPNIVSGFYYVGKRTAALASSGALTANTTVYASLIVLEETLTINQILMRCSVSLGASNVKLALYSDLNCLPNQLLEQSGAIVSGTANSDNVYNLPANRTLQPGRYWGACVVDNGTGFFGINLADGIANAVLGGSNSVRAFSSVSGITSTTAGTYAGGFNATFTGATRNVVTNSPCLIMRTA